MIQVDRDGVYAVANIVTKELNWVFREQPVSDYGIDAHIEICNEKEPVGKLIGVQIKAGTSYFKEDMGEYIVFRGKQRHLEYWLNHSLPIIIILYNPETKECIWEHINDSNVINISQSGWKIYIPRNKILNKSSLNALKAITNKTTEYKGRFQTLALAKPWMQAIKQGNNVVVEYADWVNKSSGKSSITIKIIDPNTLEEKVVLDWNVAYFPMQIYEDILKRLFPWADVEIDEEFYDEYDRQTFSENFGIYDKEDDIYHYDDEDYLEWKNRLPKIRPYENIAGEVDYYRVKLNINEIGTIFLKLDEYLENTSSYILNKDDIIE